MSPQITIYIEPTESVNYGTVFIGGSAYFTIIIRNGSESPSNLIGSVSNPASPFHLVSGVGAFNLAPGAEHFVQIRFTPTSVGSFNSYFSITHNAQNRTSPTPIYLSGTGQKAFDKTYITAAGNVNVEIRSEIDLGDADVKNIGEISIGFDDDDETLFYPSNVKITFKDKSKSIYNDMRLYSREIIIRLNGADYYSGVSDIMQVEHNDKAGDTDVVIFDGSNQLKEIKTKDNGNNSLDPLNYAGYARINIQTMIRDVFRKVSPTADLTTNQDWTFKRWASGGENLHDFSEIVLTILRFFELTSSVSTLAGLLKNLASCFGCSAGMLDRNRAFFVKRWKSSLTPISLTGKVKTIKRINLLRKLDGVRVVQHKPIVSPSHYDEGTVGTEISGEFKYPDRVSQIELYIGCSNTASNIYFWDGSVLREIGTVRDTAIDNEFREIRQTIAKYHYRYRQITREKFSITLKGIDYSILNLYSYDEKTLRPSKVEFNLRNNETKMIVRDIT